MPAGDPPLSLRDLEAIPVERLRGVGDQRREALAALGIRSVLDLLTHYPRRYLDRTRELQLAELRPGDEATVVGEVASVSSRTLKGRRTLTEVVIEDRGSRLTLTFFNQKWRERQLSEGTTVLVHGRCQSFRGRRQMTSPVVDLVGNQTGRIIPVYPQSEKVKLTTQEIANAIDEALTRCRPRGIDDPVPAGIRSRIHVIDRDTAILSIHRPESFAEQQQARNRLVFDELLRIQMELVRRKRLIEQTTRGIAHTVQGPLLDQFHSQLPFALTGAQRRAIDEIRADLARPVPMHRLLQGDVGSGKTLVAVDALLTAVQGGHQGALMAPTEVLAEQHFAGIRELLADVCVPDTAVLSGERPLRVELLINRMPAADRRRLLTGLGSGQVDLVIGTHALIQERVEFADLGVVVVDEQHRFGVEQRAALRDKGDERAAPDVLVMTATPIPRTAAMTVYGDLDVSVLDELPPGRTPIVTEWVSGAEMVSVWDAVRQVVAAGQQAYVVCPLIDESEKLEVRSAEEVFARLHTEDLADLRLGLLHGRVDTAAKDATMRAFRSGELDVLVATTVIEVGVDVPNATMMVILDADRFGIAQLHQLRGRVGRGTKASRCLLVADPTTDDGTARLEALVATTDGFELAEVDLELRGEGMLMGERQKGRNDLRLASLRRDREWVEVARAVAFELIDADHDLIGSRSLLDEVSLFLGDNDADFLLKN